jgi:hypothetical protein
MLLLLVLSSNIVRDLIETLFVVALGGMVVSMVRRISLGEIPAHLCPVCQRPTSRAYPYCRHCGAPLSPGDPPGNAPPTGPR